MEIEGQYHNVYVIKRPGVDQFMKRVGELYEVVVFTASVSKVNHISLSGGIILIRTTLSTAILFWTNLISIMWCIIDYSAKAATIIRETMSRFVQMLREVPVSVLIICRISLK